MTLLGDTEQQYCLQSPSAHFQSFLQTPAGQGCEWRGSSGQQETAERKHPKVIMAHFPNSNDPSVARERLQTEEEKLNLMPWRHFQALVACGHDCPLGGNSLCFV